MNRSKGRHRSFLITALKRFMANEWHRTHADKRGGRLVQVPLDPAIAESVPLGPQSPRSGDCGALNPRLYFRILEKGESPKFQATKQ